MCLAYVCYFKPAFFDLQSAILTSEKVRASRQCSNTCPICLMVYQSRVQCIRHLREEKTQCLAILS